MRPRADFVPGMTATKRKKPSFKETTSQFMSHLKTNSKLKIIIKLQRLLGKENTDTLKGCYETEREKYGVIIMTP